MKVKILKQPFVQFLLIGVLLFAGYQSFYNYMNREQQVIRVSSEEIQLLEQSWEVRWNRPPTPEEREGLIRQHIKEKVLYRTALEMGLDRDDMVIQRRMVQKVEYLGANLIKPPQPSEAEMIKYYEEHKEKYVAAETITITQVFFDPDKRGNATLDDANSALKELKKQDEVPSNLSTYGDAFMLANYFAGKTEMQIRKQFGGGFTESVFQLEPGTWHGPVLSGYGTHLVYVHEHIINEVPPFTEAREYVQADWMEAKKKELEEKYIDGLLARYEVIVEDEN